MFVLARAVTYSTLFIALVLVFVPAQVLSRFGVARRPAIGAVEVTGIVVGLAGALIALWCILAFVFVGKGTPAPFDPPRRLVVRGPYRFVRNPMYLGAALALIGAAIAYRSAALVGLVLLYAMIVSVFVSLYEEPTLTRLFGADYAAYCARVARWLPRFRVAPPDTGRTP